LALFNACRSDALVIPIEVINWSENCDGKIAENKAKIAVGSCSTYKTFNAVISDFNKQA
jgi:hypothetical protein